MPGSIERGLGTTQLFAKDNPAGGDDTAFALHKSTIKGGRACDRHDECYQSCTTTQEECDDRMHHDMRETCSAAKSGPTIKKRCFEWAELYYAALRKKGKDAFDDRKRSVCKCDKKSTPPHKLHPPHDLLKNSSGPKKGRFMSWPEYLLNSHWRDDLRAYKGFKDEDEYKKYITSSTDAAPEEKPKKDWLRMRY